MGVTTGDGWAAAQLDDLGEGYGFRKVRKELGVTAFGVNAIVMPAGYATGRHWHDEQEEIYFVHQGRLRFDFGDGSQHELGAGGVVRVDPATVRQVTSIGDEDAVYLAVGGKDGYVGRDGRAPDDEPRVQQAG